jgi:hypothetical protein
MGGGETSNCPVVSESGKKIPECSIGKVEKKKKKRRKKKAQQVVAQLPREICTRFLSAGGVVVVCKLHMKSKPTLPLARVSSEDS